MPTKGQRFNKCGFLSLDEIKKLRAEKKSWKVIMGFCQVAPASFYKFLKRYGLSDGKKYSCQKREYKETGIAQELARRDGYENLTDAIRALRLSGKTHKQVTEHFKGHGGLVKKFYPKDIKVHVITPEQRAAMIERAINKKRKKGHPWDTVGMYYTPKEIKEIADPATGTGAYLKDAADMLISNPPFSDGGKSAEHSVNPTETTGR